MERRPILRDALLIVLAYMAVRHGVYAALPVHSLEAWSRRDALMCLPRTAAFVALWACNAARWERAVPFAFGPVRSGFLLPSLFLVIGEACQYALLTHLHPAPLPVLLVGIAATVPVVLFEEYAFRGAILGGLASRLGPAAALLASSFLFTIFHVEAQPLRGWSSIFLIGLALGALRLRGCGLGWLALVHFAVDALFFFDVDAPPTLGGWNLARHLVLLGAVALVWRRKKIAAS